MPVPSADITTPGFIWSRVMFKKCTSLIVLLPLLSACSTVALHWDGQSDLPLYAGTQKAIAMTKKSWRDHAFFGEPMFYALDVPLCLVADTLLLPYDYYRSR